jgi:hypothetical protein
LLAQGRLGLLQCKKYEQSKLLQQAKKAFGVRLRFRGFSAALILGGKKFRRRKYENSNTYQSAFSGVQRDNRQRSHYMGRGGGVSVSVM